MIMHIDMDAFFASIEQRVNPSLRGLPLIVTGRDDKYKSVVCAASYEAKAFGIDSGMPSWQAFKLCPQVKYVAADTAKYIYTSDRIFEILKEFVPDVSINSVDEFYIDCRVLRQDLINLGAKIKARIKDEFGLTCSVGIAPTVLSAKLAAKLKKPDALVIMDAVKLKQVLKDLPVENICGIGDKTKEKLNRLGIFTCGQLSNVSLELLIEHFGKIGVWLHDVSRGEDSAGSINFNNGETLPKSIGHSQTLRCATSNPDVVKSFIYILSEMVGVRLRKLNIQAKTAHLYISSDYITGSTRQKMFNSFTSDGAEVFKRCLFLFEHFNSKFLKVRALGVCVSGFIPDDSLCLFEEEARRRRLIKGLDNINRRFGEWSVFPASFFFTKSH